MGELTLQAFLTLDGVMQAPGGPTEDPSGGFQYGGWVAPLLDDDMGREIAAFFSRADAFLLGRKTYDIFAAYWPNVTDPNDPVAGPLNARPKFVASRTRDAFDWNNTAPIRDVVGEVPGLKQRFGREVQVHGSSDLAQTLIANNLIDEYRLYVFPVILGMGKRLFGAGAIPAALRLVRSITTSTGVVISVYRPAGAVQTGEV